ncbi:MAG: aminotransferase class IV [Bacteroidota bacterium]
MNNIFFNGKIIPEDEPVLLASNRGYRYGDGLFETMKMINGIILLADYHFERLFSALSLLKFDSPKLFTKEKLEQQILQLCKKNDCENLARIRLSVFRGNGGLYDENKAMQYVIECWPLNKSVNGLNENGLVIDIYPEAAKNCDKFSNLKSANFLSYSLAALYAKENKLNDCLLLNTSGGIADSTIANVFIIKDAVISTPGPEEGCVNGVMRRYLLEKMQNAGYMTQQRAVSVNDLNNAEEVFLTSAINGIRWVRGFRDKIYTNVTTEEIYNRFVKTIHA